MSYCPVCIVQLHHNLIDALSKKWKEVGGPWRNVVLADNNERLKYSNTNRAYHKAKVDLINTMRYLEDVAEEEAS